MNDIIIYTTEDGKSQINRRTDRQTVWLTRLEMADLFDATKQNISLQLKNIFGDGELYSDSVVKDSLTTAEESSVVQVEGAREVQRPLTLYNLDAIGYYQ